MESNKTPEDEAEPVASGGDEAQAGDSLYEKKWNAAFARLKAFKAKFGHCRVPNRYAEDPQLGNWVSTQRRQYRILTTGVNKTVPLTQERAQQLIALGFEWSAKDPSHKCWEDRFEELCDYKKKYGSTLVPMGWKENPRLATWVSTQRQEYKQLKLGNSSRLNEAKVKLLTEIGFVWEAQRGRRKLPSPMESMRRVKRASEKKAKPTFSLTESKLPFQVRKPGPPSSNTSTVAASNVLADLTQQAETRRLSAQASSQAALIGSRSQTAPPANQGDLLALLGQLQAKPNPPPAGPLTGLQSGTQSLLPAFQENPGALAASAAGLDLQTLLSLPRATLEALAKKTAPTTAASTASAPPLPTSDRNTLLATLAGKSAPSLPTRDVGAKVRDDKGVVTAALLALGGVVKLEKPATSEPSQSNPVQQLLSTLGKKDPPLRQPLTPSAGVKRTLEEMLGLPGPALDSNKRLCVPSLGQSLLSPLRTDASSAKLNAAILGTPERGAEDISTDPQGLNMVRLYAASLPANSRARLALLAAPTLAEAESILKADIARNLKPPPGQPTQPQNPGLQSPPSTLPALQGTQPSRGSLLEDLKSLMPGNAQALASAQGTSAQRTAASVASLLPSIRTATDGRSALFDSLASNNNAWDEQEDRKMPARRDPSPR